MVFTFFLVKLSALYLINHPVYNNICKIKFQILESVHELVCKLYSTHYGNELSMMNFLDFVGDSHIDLVNRYIELPHVVRKSDVLEEGNQQ